MLTLAELQSRHACLGRVEAIWLRPKRGESMLAAQTAEITESGLVGDRARKGNRAVTLIQAEHVPVIASLAGLADVNVQDLRRNIVVSGLNLAAFKGKQISLGGALVEFTVPCHPCSKMESVLGHGGYTAMRGHGGMCARVLAPGVLTVGDVVQPLEDPKKPV